MASTYDQAAAEALAERLRRKRERQKAAAGASARHEEARQEDAGEVVGQARKKQRRLHNHSSLPAPADLPPGAHTKRALSSGDAAPPARQALGSHRPEVGGGSKAARVRAQKALSDARRDEAAPAEAAAALTPRMKLMMSLNARVEAKHPAAKASLSFDADWHDHCETPFDAFRDIEPLLFRIAQALGRTKETLRIYDPYFCEGTMRAHLARLGFTDVHNVDEDCYAVWEEGRTPPFDVLVTNPPFSGDHMIRALSYAASCGKPWLLLLPNFVCFKKSYDTVVPPHQQPAFLVPSKRYIFYAPGRSTDISAPTSPFDTFWHVSTRSLGDEAHDAICGWWDRKYAAATKATLARTREAVPKLVTPVRDEKRANPKARRRAAKRAAFLHNEKGISFAHIKAREAKKKKWGHVA
jgi:hypothetical protein